jgi:excisionase family DNA binding protein
MLTDPVDGARIGGRTPYPRPVGNVPGVRRESNPLFTAREVAARLQISTKTVYALVRRQELACVRVSNAVRVRPEDLEAYLSQ